MKRLFFYLKNNKHSQFVIEEAKKNHKVNKNLSVSILEDAYVLPSRNWKDIAVEGGVIDSAGNYVLSSACYEGGSCGYAFESSKVKEGKECIFIGFFLLCYGHAITDAFRKLWYLETDEGKKIIERGAELVFISNPNTKLPVWYIRLLELAGVNVKLLHHVKEITRYKRIIIPDNCLFTENGSMFYTDEFVKIIDRVKRSIDKGKDFPLYKKIYFTRTSLQQGGRERGEKVIENLFRDEGYKIISPEKIPEDEKIWMLMNCNNFAATECSSSHSAIFCNQTAEMIILKKADYINYYSSMIADFVGCKTVYINAHHTIRIHRKGHMWGPFYLCVTPQLRKYLKKKGVYKPYWLHKSYWGYIVYIISLIIKRIMFHLGIHK